MVDYAGLFPPASEPLATAMTAYKTYQQPDDVGLLGRFLLPVAALPAFIKQCLKKENLQKENLNVGISTWPLSLLIHTTTPELLAALPYCSDNTYLSIVALEFLPQPPEMIADIMASGTISGSGPGSQGSLLEITQQGRLPISLPSGEIRTFLADGDEVIVRASCKKSGFASIGFGECRGQITTCKSNNRKE